MCEVTGFFDYVMFLESPKRAVVFLNLETCSYASEAHFWNMPFWTQMVYRNDPRYRWLYNIKPGYESYYLRKKNKEGTLAEPGPAAAVGTAVPANREAVEPLVIPPELLEDDPMPGSTPGWLKNILAIGAVVLIVIVACVLIKRNK